MTAATKIREDLKAVSEPEYAAFTAKLSPTLPSETILGVRLPALRAYAKALKKSPDLDAFLHGLPHATHEENLLHAILLQSMSGFPRTMEEVCRFLPYVNCWSVCDTLRPKCFEKHKAEVLPYVEKWLASRETYTVRFAVDVLMTFFLDEDFRPEYLEKVCGVTHEDYYVRMMVAWYFATALAKQWDAAIPYLKTPRLAPWTHNKTISKAIESFRITEEQKTYLRALRVEVPKEKS